SVQSKESVSRILCSIQKSLICTAKISWKKLVLLMKSLSKKYWFQNRIFLSLLRARHLQNITDRLKMPESDCFISTNMTKPNRWQGQNMRRCSENCSERKRKQMNCLKRLKKITMKSFQKSKIQIKTNQLFLPTKFMVMFGICRAAEVFRRGFSKMQAAIICGRTMTR